MFKKKLKGFTNVDANKLFSVDRSSRTRIKGEKLRCRQIQLDSTTFFFTNDVARKWDKLPLSVVQCDTINSFKNKLDHHLFSRGIRLKQDFPNFGHDPQTGHKPISEGHGASNCVYKSIEIVRREK